MDEKRKNNIVRYSGNKEVMRYHAKYIKINFVENMAYKSISQSKETKISN